MDREMPQSMLTSFSTLRHKAWLTRREKPSLRDNPPADRLPNVRTAIQCGNKHCYRHEEASKVDDQEDRAEFVLIWTLGSGWGSKVQAAVLYQGSQSGSRP